MANHVKLFHRPDGSFDLVVNSLQAKNFNAAGNVEAMEEAGTYLESAEGISRLSGSFTDLGDEDISFVNNSDSTVYDIVKIEFVDQFN